MSEDRNPVPEDAHDEYRSLTTDIAIGLGPTAAIVAGHLLNQGRDPGDTTINNITIIENDPPPAEPEK
jgi:hypothetical protein